MDPTKQIETSQRFRPLCKYKTPKYAIIVEPKANHIQGETTGGILGCRYLVKMDEPEWKNSICNELGRLS